MPAIVALPQIREALEKIDPVEGIIGEIEQGFVAYSQGKVVVPPVGELLFDQPRGETHIKYGYIRGDDYFVVKIASGFYENPKIGLPAGSGLMLLFSRLTGELLCILLDEGHLTNVRTAAAGARSKSPKSMRRFTCTVREGIGLASVHCSSTAISCGPSSP